MSPAVLADVAEGEARSEVCQHEQKHQQPDGTTLLICPTSGVRLNAPTIFYIPLPGKIKPIAGQKLKPENVCWDITAGIESNDSDSLPVLFMTGYRVNYISSGHAALLGTLPPQFGIE
jgi:hypothetical protein